MAHGDFIWRDLSTFDAAVTQPFYSALFGWRYSGSDDYAIASASNAPVAAIFPMPQKFRDIRMPSFWMSYIAVDDIDAAVETARAQGGKVEIGPAPFEGGGRYALIRDPLGAGFTVYQGDALGAGAGTGHGLFVSDAGKVMPFYSALFGWRFERGSHDVFAIRNRGRTIAHLHEIPDDALRGKEQYWAILFAGSAESRGRAQIEAGGGEIVAETRLPEGPALLARDPNGAAFFLLEKGGSVETSADPVTGNHLHWKAWIGLGLMALLVLTGWNWIWTVFLGVWALEGLRQRETYLFERVSRDQAPVLYWILIVTYAALAILAAVWPEP